MTGEDDEIQPVSGSVWRYAKASRAHLVIDSDDYFLLAQEAMLKARQRVFLIGWDFDTRIRLGKGRRWWNLPRRRRHPARLGAFMVWLVKRTPGLRIHLLKWNFGAVRFVFRGSMILDLARFVLNRSISLRLDATHPLGCSHHQKIMVIDDKVAACGGIDMTSDRWDTREHRHLDNRRRRPNRKLYGPWHDVTMLMEGEVAGALGDLGRMRWQESGAEPMARCLPQTETPWPDTLVADFENVEIGIARTRAEWRDLGEIREVEELFVEQIARAKRFVYAESQYFASRRIAEAIALRLAEPDPPEFLLINPQTADGWLQAAAMDSARARLVHAIEERDHARRFRIFIPVTSGGTPIYVHSKLMIVDDEILRVGSANMNNRSMGLDSEADVFIDAARPGNGHIVPAITRLRHSLIAEHCGIPDERATALLEQHATMAEMIDSLADQGKRLEPFALRALTDAEIAIADGAFLDSERPGEIFEPIGLKRGLFRRGGFLRRPKRWRQQKA